MRITHEEPGRRLELVKSEDRFSLSGLAIILGLTALLATPWRGLWAILMHGAARDTLDLVPSAIWAAGGLFIVLSAFGGHRLEGLSADRDAGRLEWRRSHVLGLVRWTGGWALESFGGLTVALAAREGPPSSSRRRSRSGKTPPLRARWRSRSPASSPRPSGSSCARPTLGEDSLRWRQRGRLQSGLRQASGAAPAHEREA